MTTWFKEFFIRSTIFKYLLWELLLALNYNINYHNDYFMKNIFNPVYRVDYLEGYSNGLNPYLKISPNKNEAYNFGFEQGRVDYERMNGKIKIRIFPVFLKLRDYSKISQFCSI